MTDDRFSGTPPITQGGAAIAPNDPAAPPAPESPKRLRLKGSFAAQAPLLGAEAAQNGREQARTGVREG